MAFVSEQQRAFEWYKKMAEICRSYAQAMNNAAQKYMETDSQAASTIKAR